jgi:hypothetical protein
MSEDTGEQKGGTGDAGGSGGDGKSGGGKGGGGGGGWPSKTGKKSGRGRDFAPPKGPKPR